jgi:carbamoyl-phosphate synthase large subunit
LTTKFKSHSNIFDKYLCFKEFEKLQIGFCKSYLPSNFTLNFENIILKPRRGSGSKGIVKNPSNILDFDDNYIIQEYKKGLELTIPFYVNLNHILLGFLPLIKFGTAPNNSYQTYTRLNEEIQTILLKIIEAFEIKGPCNLQCIVNDDGIHPFEMNFRYSGSIDIQDQLGFEILRIGIAEFISNKAYSQKPIIFNGFAVRQYHSEVFKNKDIFSETDFTYE